MFLFSILGLGSLSLLTVCFLQYFGAYYINLLAGFGMIFAFFVFYCGIVYLRAKRKPSGSIAFCFLWGILEGIVGSGLAFLIDFLIPVFHVPFMIFIFYAALLVVLAVLIESYMFFIEGGAVKG